MTMTWRERIAAARDRGRFTKRETKLAESWHTCAIGEQHQQLPDVVVYMPDSDKTASPDDPHLCRLGHDFYRTVMRGCADDAEALLDQIEDRVLQLKRGGQA